MSRRRVVVTGVGAVTRTARNISAGRLEDRVPVPGKGDEIDQLANTFNAMLDATKGYERAVLFSDIGCYTLGCMAPFEAVHSCVDMGASISMAHGAAQAWVSPRQSLPEASLTEESSNRPMAVA